MTGSTVSRSWRLRAARTSCFLVREVPEQGRRTHARGDGNGLQRHFRAVLAEALAGGGDDLVDVARSIGTERLAVYCAVHLPRLATQGLRDTVTGW